MSAEKKEGHNSFLSAHDFAAAIRLTPLVAIDLVLVDPAGAVLVGQRTTEPAKGYWFVPGGRITKNEKLDDAFARILKAETGMVEHRGAAQCIGIYEHLYATNRFEDPDYGTHYVVVAYQLALPVRPSITADGQHASMRWMLPGEILESADVHENTKAYFR